MSKVELARAYDALQQADAAGNKEDAQQLADYIRELETQQSANQKADDNYLKQQATDDMIENPLTYGVTGTVAGLVAGPTLTKGVDLVTPESLKPGAAPIAGPAVPQAQPNVVAKTPFNPRGVSVEQSVDNWRTYSEAQNEAAKGIRRDTALAKKYPNFERNQTTPNAIPPKLTPQQKATMMLQSPTASPPNRVGQMYGAGMAAGQGADAISQARQGNLGQAAISGIGSVGGVASMSSNPRLRLLGRGITTAAPILRSMTAPEEKAAGGLAGYAGGNVVKKAGVAAKKAMSNLDLGKKIPESSFTASPEQTVSNPLRNAFPGIYKRPDVIAREASERVAPESPALKQLFGVTRDDLYQMGKGRTGNMPGMLPGAAANPKGSKAATAVMNPRNEQRLLDVLGESEKYPELVRGMDPWYIMDPAYKRLEELVGPEEAMRKYKQFNTMTGMASPGSDVLTEMNRGTAANFLATQGRFDDFLKYGGKGFNPEAPADIQNILGHPYHMTAQGKPMKQYLDTGEIQMSSPKVPMYIDASGVPQTGFQTDMPVGDAHWSRAVGLADTRGNATRKGKSVVPGASVSNPEMSQLGPWWRDKIASQSGLESVPAQARAWGAFSPQTGVESPIGAPKLELLSIKIMEAADRYGVSPEQARDMILKGEGYAGKAAGGLIALENS
jgi:hypothetical protein